MLGIPDLPPAMLVANDRNSMRSRRLVAFISEHQHWPEDMLRPYYAELERRIAGNKVGRVGAVVNVRRA